MDPKLYEVKRDQLVGLIDETLLIKDLPLSCAGPLGKIRKRLLENQFEITLVAEFGGGKSTTLNALCDGREIAPRGFGIKTSGCLVSAQNISDPEGKEHAAVVWRDKYELALGFSDLIRQGLVKASPSHFKPEDSAENIASKLDLDRENDLELVKGILAGIWEEYGGNKQAFPPEKLDLLRVASLTAHFFDTPKYRELTSKSEMPLEEARSLMAFPTDWAARWLGEDPSKFKLVEVAFIFIARIRCFVRSRNLQRVGCVVTDCPGLFASAWDTKVALDAMFHTDGLWFLLDGSKAIGQSTVEMIRFIVERGWRQKLFFAVNMRGNAKNIILDQIIPADLAALSQIGVEAKREDLVPYHAALGLRAVQAKRCLDKTVGLDDATRKIILQDAKAADCDSASVEEALLCMIQDHLQSIKAPARKTVVEWGENAVEVARDESHLAAILKSIEERAITEKARSILIHNGAAKIAELLSDYEGWLQILEDTAKKRRDAFEVEAQKARKALLDFQEDAEQAIDELRHVEISPLARHLREAVFKDLVENVAKRSARRIYKEVLGAWEVTKAMFNTAEKTRIDNNCGQIISQEFEKVIAPRLVRWLGDIKSGENRVYQETIADSVKRVNVRLRSRWREFKSHESLLENLSLPEISGDRVLDRGLLDEAVDPSSLEIPSLVNVVDARLVGASLAVITGGILVLCANPLGWVAVAGGVVWATIQQVIGQPLEDRVCTSLSGLLAKKMREGFFEREKEIDKGFLDQASSFRSQYVGVFERAVKTLGTKFDETIATASNNFDKSEAERREISENAKNSREQHVAPLRVRVEQFKAEVEDLLNRPAEEAQPCRKLLN